jgi:hypothetical protein
MYIHTVQPLPQSNLQKTYTVQQPALILGIQCYVDASTLPDQPNPMAKLVGLGILIVNMQVQPVHCIYISACMYQTHSVVMAEVAAVALGAMLVSNLNLREVSYFSDCSHLVQFLNSKDQNHPPVWRMKPFT